MEKDSDQESFMTDAEIELFWSKPLQGLDRIWIEESVQASKDAGVDARRLRWEMCRWSP